jgi:hypothetical protein
MKSTRDLSLLRFVGSVYFAPITLATVAIVPGLNLLYSVHGGIAWLVLPFAFPISLYRLFRVWRDASIEQLPRIKRLAGVSFVLYFPVSFAASFAGARSIESYLGAPISSLFVWGLFTIPIGLVFCWDFFVP